VFPGSIRSVNNHGQSRINQLLLEPTTAVIRRVSELNCASLNERKRIL
jgi:hypothetical protein